MKGMDILNTAGDKFDSLSEEEKKEAFLKTVEGIEKNQDFQKLKKYRDELDEDKKLDYYNKGEIISIKGSIKYSTGFSAESLKPTLNPLKMIGEAKDNMKEEVYQKASPLMRIGVSFGLLTPPKKLDEKKLLKNIQKDAHRLRRNLGIFEKVCAVVPQLKVAQPIVKAIRPYAKRYEKEGATLMQERIKNNEFKDTETTTVEGLSTIEQNIVKSEVVGQSEGGDSSK